MIEQITSDADWLARFANTPTWQPERKPTLVVAPHPDDETLGAGALIATLRAAGVPVTVVAATDGENAYETSDAERQALRKTREAEQRAALATLGVEAENIFRLRLTDSGLYTQESELTQRLLEHVEPGMQVVAPWSGDFHPDHEACARAAAAVCKSKGLPLISYFFWTWHRGWPDLLDAEPVVRFVPSQDALAAKAKALAEHRSQLEREGGEPILPEKFLWPARWPFEIFLPMEVSA